MDTKTPSKFMLYSKIKFILRKLIKLHKQLIVRLKNEVMVRELCEEKGLTKEQTELIVAVIKCESGMDDRAVNKNRNKTIDYGICQFNDYWYWAVHNIIHPDIALNDPRIAVKVMIDRFLDGHINDWVCYRSGAYRKFLNNEKT